MADLALNLKRNDIALALAFYLRPEMRHCLSITMFNFRILIAS